MKQVNAAEDGKTDIFLSETDCVNRYINVEADVAIPLKDLGIDPGKDLADRYDFTKVTVSDAESVQRGSTRQYYPGLSAYHRDTAKEVFGTDDPVIIGEKTSNRDTLKTTAGELAAKGYFTFTPYVDTFRLYGDGIAQSQVVNSETTIKVGKQIVNWIKDSKKWLGTQYSNKTVRGQWDDDWNKIMGSESKVFIFLLPAWGTDFVLSPNQDGEAGAWVVTTPLRECSWGDSYVHAATGTDSTEHVKDIILAVTTDKDNLLEISKNYADFINTKSGMQEAAEDSSFASELLRRWNPFVYYAPVAEEIKIVLLSTYDQGYVGLIQNSSSDCFRGKADYGKAKTNFETAIKERYPDITEVEQHG